MCNPEATPVVSTVAPIGAPSAAVTPCAIALRPCVRATSFALALALLVAPVCAHAAFEPSDPGVAPGSGLYSNDPLLRENPPPGSPTPLRGEITAHTSVALLGTLQFGYPGLALGPQARLEVPVVRLLRGDNRLTLGLDAAFLYVTDPSLRGTNFIVPVTLAAGWRYGVGWFYIGPRVGFSVSIPVSIPPAGAAANPVLPGFDGVIGVQAVWRRDVGALLGVDLLFGGSVAFALSIGVKF